MQSTQTLHKIKAIILDIDGTLLRGNLPLPGLSDLFEFLRRNNIAFVVASNNATKTPTTYQQKLARAGAEINVDNVMTCSLATAGYLKRQFPEGCSVYVVGQDGLHSALRAAGFNILEDASEKAEAAVVGGDYTLTYDKLKYAALHIQRGARFIGTNPDMVYPTEEGLVPECGTTLAALQAATGVEPTVIGKPERYLFEMAVEKMGSSPEQTAMLGDRLDTDIYGGRQVGLTTILIETGVDSENTVPVKGIIPDLIVRDLHHLVQLWEEQLLSFVMDE